MLKTDWIRIVLIGILLMGCTQSIDSSAHESTKIHPIGTVTSVLISPTLLDATPNRFDQPPTQLPERVPPTEMFQPVTGEVPDELLDEILVDFVRHTGTSLAEVTVIRAQEMVWNDGSLGCPQPDVFYTQALVNGYWVVLETGGIEIDYRASDTGYFFLCESGDLPISPQSTPDS